MTHQFICSGCPHGQWCYAAEVDVQCVPFSDDILETVRDYVTDPNYAAKRLENALCADDSGIIELDDSF